MFCNNLMIIINLLFSYDFVIATAPWRCVTDVGWKKKRNKFPRRRSSLFPRFRRLIERITGAARGIGRELALRFSRLGARIACVDIIESENDETSALIKQEGGISASYKCDVSDKDQVRATHQRVKKELGPVDVLINNAGIVWGHIYVDPSKDQFITDQINVNLMAQYWMNREVLPSMLDRNLGHIVAMSSMSSMAGVAGISTYTVTKWATNGMMECLRNELLQFNSDVKTTTILPYFVETNPKVSAQLEIRLPELPTEMAASIMVKGILQEKRIFSVPGHMMHATAFIRLLPDFLRDMFDRIFYVRIIEDSNSAEIVSKYKRL